MHMLSEKDLISAELEIVRVSSNLTTVLTANGEVRPNEEATVYVFDVDVLLTVQIVVDTSSVLSFGKRCEDHGYSNEWISGQKPHLVGSSKKIQCNTENYAPIVVAGLSTEPSSSATSAS